MTINTKFGIGDRALFIDEGRILSRVVKRIDVEIRTKTSSDGEAPGDPLITYHFIQDPSDHAGRENLIYKYENEVFATKEELVANVQVQVR